MTARASHPATAAADLEQDLAATALAWCTADRRAAPAHIGPSRCLTGASHELRQPLQTLALLGRLLAQTVEADSAKELVARLDNAVATLSRTLDRLLAANETEGGAACAMHPHARHSAGAPGTAEQPVIFVIDDDIRVREAIRGVLEADGHSVEEYAACESFLEAYRPTREACLLLDVYLPGMNGLELLQRLRRAGQGLPAILLSGNGDVKMAVQAMKAGASDFIEKPIGGGELLASVERALQQSRDARTLLAGREAAASHIAGLTPRQREIMELVLAGHPSKNIAADLRISQRTVENHRAAIMKRTGAKSLPALARLAVAVASDGAPLAGIGRMRGASGHGST